MLKSTTYSFTVKPDKLPKLKLSLKHNQNMCMSKTVLCLFLAKKQCHVMYIIGLVEFTLFSDIKRKTKKENSFVGKNSSDGQLDSYSCHSRTQNKKL